MCPRNPERQHYKRDLGGFLWPLIVLAGIFGVSSIPSEESETITVVYEAFERIPKVVHDLLHIPAYALLAWTLYHPLGRRVDAGAAFALAVIIASAYGGLMELYQANVPGRYPSLIDVVMNLIGAFLGAWFAYKRTADGVAEVRRESR